MKTILNNFKSIIWLTFSISCIVLILFVTGVDAQPPGMPSSPSQAPVGIWGIALLVMLSGLIGWHKLRGKK